MRRFFGVVVAVAVLMFLAAQLYRPTIEHPPVTAEIQAPPEVKQIAELLLQLPLERDAVVVV